MRPQEDDLRCPITAFDVLLPDEASAIQRLRLSLKEKPQTFSDINPQVHTEKVAKGTTCFQKTKRRRTRQTVMLRDPRFRNPSWKDQGRGTDHRQDHARYATWCSRDAHNQTKQKTRANPSSLGVPRGGSMPPCRTIGSAPLFSIFSFSGQVASVYKAPRNTGAQVR